MRKFQEIYKTIYGIFLMIITLSMVSYSENILFITGNANNLSNDDDILINRLVDQQHSVTVRDDNEVILSDADNMKMILITSTCTQTALGSLFRDIEIPVICWNEALLADMDMSGPTLDVDFGIENAQTLIDITNSSHSITGELTGTVTVYSKPNSCTWGVPGIGAVSVATIHMGDGTRQTIFTYDQNSQLFSGSPAPAKRICMFLNGNYGTRMTNDGWTLFDGAVAWALDKPPFEGFVKRTGDKMVDNTSHLDMNGADILNAGTITAENFIGDIPSGLDGLNCWDINGDGFNDPEEDINDDGMWNAFDCQGPQGLAGNNGAPGTDGVGVTTVTSSDNGDGTFDITFNKTDGSSVTITTPNLIGNDGVGISTITSTDNGDGTFNVTFNKTDGTSVTIITPNLRGNDGVGITNITSVDNGNGTFNVNFNMTDGSQQTITTPDLTGPQGNPGAPGQPGQDGIGITGITSNDNGNGTFNITFNKTDGSSEIITTPYLRGSPGDQGETGENGVGITNIISSDNGDGTFNILFSKSDGSSEMITTPFLKGDPGTPGADGVGVTTISSTDNEDGTFNITFSKTDGSSATITSPYLKGDRGDQGDPGTPGDNGIHCWDTNGDGINDPAEDRNGDGLWNTADCQGPKGDKGDQGCVVQIVNTQTGEVATGRTIIPSDNTIPQQTEGTEFMTLAITPTSATNKLKIDVVMQAHDDGEFAYTVALFQDAKMNAIAVAQAASGGGSMSETTFSHYMTAGTTSETTFKVRAGDYYGSQITFNGALGSRMWGGKMASSITITEIVP